MAATFDNPSYFTISGQSPVPTATTPTDIVESIGAKPKRFKSWFKLPKRPFRSKVALDQPENTDRCSGNSPPPASPEPEPQSNLNDFAHSEVVYYNFCSATQQDPAPSSTEVNNDDDVFSDTSTIRGVGSTRTLSRRRHSLGSWFRSSLAAVRKHNTGASTASGLESHDTATETNERPSTSSERALLARNVSTSVNCVSTASARDIRTPERGRSAEAEPTGAEKVDVVIIFSKNCVVSYQWIAYLTGILGKIFSSSDRPPTRVTSRDVESLVDSTSSNISTSGRHKPPPTPPVHGMQKCDYQNVAATEQLDVERGARQHAVRKTVATASLQIVLLSKALLNHVGLHANDPLGTLLHPKRVLGLMLGVDEFKDIVPLHRSALCSFDFWPKIVMRDQDMKSVNEFGERAQSILGRSQPVALIEANLQPARFKIAPKKLRSGEERVTMILMETTENIKHMATVQVGVDLNNQLNKSVHIERLCWVNPYVITFNVPKKFLELDVVVKVQLKVGNHSWGVRDLKCQSKLGEIGVLLSKCQLMGSPAEVMCQALKISPVDTEKLDQVLTRSLDKAKISLSAFGLEQTEDELRDEEYPTLLHFSARCGLKNLTWALLECVGAVQAIYVRNCNGLTALELAEENGHNGVINCLQSFIQILDAANSQPQTGPQSDDYVQMNKSTTVETEINDYDFVPKPKLVNSATHDVETKQKCQGEQEIIRGAVGGSGPDEEKSPEKIHNTTKTGLTKEDQLRMQKRDNNINPALQKMPGQSPENEETIPEVILTSGSPFTVIPSRASSRLSSWSSSDRSSVASHLSHDSGTHFESSEERKVLGNIRNDYDVPPAIVIPHFAMSNYVVPPPPRPIDGREDDDYIPILTGIRFNRDLSPRSSPRPPTIFRYPFEAIELNPPASQAVLGEDLGLIIPNGEPEFMEQAPILLPSYSQNDPSRVEGEEPVYMTMTPRCGRRKGHLEAATCEGNSVSISNVIEEDDYIATAELNMPTAYLASTTPRLTRGGAIRQRETLRVSKNLSNSENQLLASNLDAPLSDWHSYPLLDINTPIPAPRCIGVNCAVPKVPPRKISTPSPCRSPKSSKHKI
ncbi:hypothetical protein DAPPUDRAFT_321563 [Daphnia pulex]|uniref:DBB domain-containing protein n=1 Tax=Daphnia pulex TaxID=6669 RepID=E9GT12_DAPPU|nr:hypothetical protein DAPPUDRAFT_321563 [Daphnia pulex]|eukprot:EFX77290.1 hypothetical protein DAPPUDRAFT_321563 [Daphnia pulex]